MEVREPSFDRSFGMGVCPPLPWLRFCLVFFEPVLGESFTLFLSETSSLTGSPKM